MDSDSDAPTTSISADALELGKIVVLYKNNL